MAIKAAPIYRTSTRADELRAGDVLRHEGIAKAIDTVATIGESTLIEFQDGSMFRLDAADTLKVAR